MWSWPCPLVFLLCVLRGAHPGPACRISEFPCRNGGCVRLNSYCDGNDDCGDMSDEPAFCTGEYRISSVVLIVPRRNIEEVESWGSCLAAIHLYTWQKIFVQTDASTEMSFDKMLSPALLLIYRTAQS